MRLAFLFLAFLLCSPLPARAPSPSTEGHSGTGAGKAASGPSAAAAPREIDGIAARIEGDILAESQVRELEDFQRLVEGRAETRQQVIEKLIDQWVVHNEAAAANFPRPSSGDVTRALAELAKQFPSPQDFDRRLADVGLSTGDVRKMLARQIYFSRFLDYRFHAASQVSETQVRAYYEQELVPELQKRGLAVPPLKQSEGQIRQLLAQKEINQRAARWLEEARARLNVVIEPSEDGR